MKKYILALLLAAAISPNFAIPGQKGVNTTDYCDCIGGKGVPTYGQSTSSIAGELVSVYISWIFFVLGVER